MSQDGASCFWKVLHVMWAFLLLCDLKWSHNSLSE
jgi:hypothetical protein